MHTHPPHVLLLAPGAKVGLTERLAAATHARGGTLSGWEADEFSPAVTLCDQRVDGGAVDDDTRVRVLLEWCGGARVDLVVPSRHDDLPALSLARDLFAAAGITVAISAPETIALCVDKIACHTWLSSHGMPTPEQATRATLASSALAGRFPVIAKHPRGSGSRQVRLCHSPADLPGVPQDWIIQSFAAGSEFTINTYATKDGRCACEIPHERLLTSEGEVVRGRTARNPVLTDLARRITESLPGARGPLNIQMFWDTTTQHATVIEINPRFGGGYPLAHEAGGRFTEWLLAEYCDGGTAPRMDDWGDGLTMVRYREARFFRASART